MFEDHLVALTPVLAVESTGLAFFRTTLGLYTAVGLSFVAAALLVWALGNLFAAGDTSLESMLNRYAQGGDAAWTKRNPTSSKQHWLRKRSSFRKLSLKTKASHQDRGFARTSSSAIAGR